MTIKKQYLATLVMCLTALTISATKAAPAKAIDDRPELPGACIELEVQQGNSAAFHVYAIGVQIYRWNGTAWVFVAPEANLYANEDYTGLVGTHYAGPTWESNSGSTVVAARTKDCRPDPSAIPWLLLQKVTSDGPGIFSPVSFIQRVNTSGGVAPAEPGTMIGQEARVPYTAEYYFYRGEN